MKALASPPTGTPATLRRRVWRIARWVLAVPLALLLLFVLGVLGHNEWRHARSLADAAVPPVAVPADPAAAPVIVLLHGAGLNGRAWDPVRRQIDPRWRVVTPDLPGHTADRGHVYTLQAATAQVAAIARAVAPAPLILVGDSLGGFTALGAAAAVPPAQLRGLVVAGASGSMGLRATFAYLRDAPLVRVMSATLDVRRRIGGLLQSMGYGAADAQAVVDAGVELNAVPAAVRELLFVDFRARLAALDVPVLITNGSLDERAVSQEDEFAAAARQLQRHRFENVEHGVSMRRSGEFAVLVNRFAAMVFAAPGAPA